jgi:hypothetical protein
MQGFYDQIKSACSIAKLISETEQEICVLQKQNKVLGTKAKKIRTNCAKIIVLQHRLAYINTFLQSNME